MEGEEEATGAAAVFTTAVRGGGCGARRRAPGAASCEDGATSLVLLPFVAIFMVS